MSLSRSRQHTRSGSIAPLTAFLLIPLMGFVAFAIDIGYIATTRTQLQVAADAAALAAASAVITNNGPTHQTDANNRAKQFAAAHRAGNDIVRVEPTTDVEYGFWDTNTRAFTAPKMSEANVKINAVRVRAYRNTSNASGRLPLFFARVFGIDSVDVSVEAIAYVPNPVLTRKSSGIGTRFLIDEDMFNSGDPAIQQLATNLGMSPETLISAKNEKSTTTADWFLNIPAGTVLELPTGQVGDEGLFDISANLGKPNLPQYPFQTGTSHSKFLKFNDTSENDAVSQSRKAMLTDSQQDPLHGVGRFNQPSEYPGLVNPNFIHVSPVWKSDVSALNGVDQADQTAGPDLNGDGQVDGYTINQINDKGVNSKGYRRGLLAFKITGYKIDTSRPYPYLPKLIIEIVNPTTIDLDTIKAEPSELIYTAGGAKNVRLVR